MMASGRTPLLFGLLVAAFGPTGCFDPTEVADEGSTGGSGGSGGSDGTSSGDGSGDGTDGSGDDGSDDTTGGDTTGGDGSDGAVVSGERLRRRDFVADGGAAVYRGLHDLELDLDCAFEWAEDGALRCLPELLLNVAYADPGCTMPVFPVTDTCTFDYVYERTRDYACGEHSLYTVYRIDHEGAASSGTFYYQTSGGCIEASTSDELLPVELVPAESFVAGAHDDVPREGGVVARFVAADDGARVITELRDEARDAACWAASAEDRCRPVRAAGTSPPDEPGANFADAACDVHVAVWNFDDPCPPDATMIYGEGCDSLPSYFEVGAQSDPADVTQYDGVSCEPFGAYGPPFAVGASIAYESFPPIDHAEAGAGRLLAWADVSTAGEPLSPGRGFIDTETGECCRVARFADDTYRCVPNDAIITSEFETPVFAEAGCTGDRLVRPFSCGPSPDYVLAIDFVYCTGEVVEEVYAVGDVFDGATAYADYGDGCMPIDVVRGEYMRQGATVPASTFAAVTEAVE